MIGSPVSSDLAGSRLTGVCSALLGAEGDKATMALVRAFEFLVKLLPQGWADRRAGAIAAVTGIPLPTLNLVLVDQAQAEVALVGELLDRVGDAGVPYCLQSRPDAREPLSALASERGMQSESDIPLMALRSKDLNLPNTPPQMHLRLLTPEEAATHARVAAGGFEAPEELFRELVPPALLLAEGVRCYVGEVDGEPVTTALGIVLGDSVGVFNVATPPAHRGRGYGGAATAYVVSDGTRSGASWAWLQSSSAGLPLYEHLGFRTLEQWPCWVSA